MLVRLSVIDFNPRSPYGERRYMLYQFDTQSLFQSTLPLRGATLVSSTSPPGPNISIHAPLTGSDLLQPLPEPVRPHFNPRSPYGERQIRPVATDPCEVFQSTLPLRGATGPSDTLPLDVKISIHAPLTGSDRAYRMPQVIRTVFQSTLPLRGATFWH